MRTKSGLGLAGMSFLASAALTGCMTAPSTPNFQPTAAQQAAWNHQYPTTAGRTWQQGQAAQAQAQVAQQNGQPNPYPVPIQRQQQQAQQQSSAAPTLSTSNSPVFASNAASALMAPSSRTATPAAYAQANETIVRPPGAAGQTEVVRFPNVTMTLSPTLSITWPSAGESVATPNYSNANAGSVRTTAPVEQPVAPPPPVPVGNTVVDIPPPPPPPVLSNS